MDSGNTRQPDACQARLAASRPPGGWSQPRYLLGSTRCTLLSVPSVDLARNDQNPVSLVKTKHLYSDPFDLVFVAANATLANRVTRYSSLGGRVSVVRSVVESTVQVNNPGDDDLDAKLEIEAEDVGLVFDPRPLQAATHPAPSSVRCMLRRTIRDTRFAAAAMGCSDHPEVDIRIAASAEIVRLV